jgi:hypothetical protein
MNAAATRVLGRLDDGNHDGCDFGIGTFTRDTSQCMLLGRSTSVAAVLVYSTRWFPILASDAVGRRVAQYLYYEYSR